MGSILDVEKHSRLIQEIDAVAARANIPVHLIHQSSIPYLTSVEADWLKTVKAHHLENKFGLVIKGQVSVSVQIKFMAMAAVLVRNFIDGMVITLADLIGPEVPSPTVLLIPNFYTTSEGKPLTSWQLQEIQSVLTRRIVECKQTVLYVSDVKMMKQHYGEAIATLLQNNYDAAGE